MEDAPKDGRQIIVYVRNTNREVRVRWNGHYWDEGNGERWDPSQLVNWKHVNDMYKALPCDCDDPNCEYWRVSQVANVLDVAFTEVQARMVAHLLNFLDDTIAIDDFQQKLDHVRSTGEWPEY